MNINTSSSSYVTGASSNKGFSGLASGLDTESMVEAMLAGTQSKIDKQNALKQQIEWKQEIYRDIITQINDFQSKFFSTTSSTSLLNQTFYNLMNAVSASNAFKVTASSSAAVGNTNIEVRQLATNTSVTSGQNVSGKLEASFQTEAFDQILQKQLGDAAAYTVNFQVGEETVEVNLRDVFVDGNTLRNYDGQSGLDKALEQKLNEALSGKGVTAAVENGVVSLVSDSAEKAIRVGDGSGTLGLERLGLTTSSRSTADQSADTATLTGQKVGLASVEFDVTLDDLSKTIRLNLQDITDADGKLDTSKFYTQLQSALDIAHGKGQVTVVETEGGFELKVSAGRKVMLSGGQEAMDLLGVKSGQSNRIAMGGSLKDLYFSNKLQGGSFRFSINGVEFHFTEDDTMSEIISAINRSDAGVRLVYRTQDDTFTLETTDSGAGRQIQMSQTEGNLLNALFGAGVDGSLASGGRVSSDQLSLGGRIAGNPLLGEDEFQVAEGTFKLQVNGTAYTLSLPRRTGDDGGEYSLEAAVEALNKQLDEKFGAGNINLVQGEGGRWDLSVKNGAVVTVTTGELDSPSDPEAAKQAALAGDLGLALFGVGGASNQVTGDTTLGELGLTLYGQDGAAMGADVKLSEIGQYNAALSFEDGRIVVNDQGKGLSFGDKDTMMKLFGQETLDLGVQSGANAVLVEGQNAIVKVDGVLTERSSNTFSINGLNFTLQELTGSYSQAAGQLVDSEGQPVTLTEGQYVEDGVLYSADGTALQTGLFYEVDGQRTTASGLSLDRNGNLQVFNGTVEKVQVERDTDQIVDGIKQFIDEYNKLIKTLNDYLDEDTSYRDYAPLTDAQKKEMTEKEIELWEEKAKTGLLHRDSTIESFLQAMRTTLYDKPAGSAYAIYDLGIETGEWESKGQLVMTADGEARLRQILESDPDSVMKLFTDSETGLLTRLNEIIDDTAKISSGSPGTLVELAGVQGKASESNNTLYRQLKEIDERIEALKRTYEKEKERYWSDFNTMEQLISNMNTQSMWLSSQLSM